MKSIFNPFGIESPRKAEKIRDTSIKMFAVVPYDEKLGHSGTLEESNIKLLTIVPTMADAIEYVHARFRILNNEHFTLWCNVHAGEDASSDSSWHKYASTVLDVRDLKNDYTIITLYYRVKDLATICRMHEHCVPLGCSYDDEREVDTMASEIAKNITKDTLKKSSKSKKDTSDKNTKSKPLNGDDPEVFKSVFSDSLAKDNTSASPSSNTKKKVTKKTK